MGWFWPWRGVEVEKRRCDRSSSLELEFERGIATDLFVKFW